MVRHAASAVLQLLLRRSSAASGPLGGWAGRRGVKVNRCAGLGYGANLLARTEGHSVHAPPLLGRRAVLGGAALLLLWGC